MPSKPAANGKPFTVSDKVFTWTTDDNTKIVLPLRLKLKVLRSMAGDDMDVTAMFKIVDAIAPGQGEVLDEMDVNDFTACFTAWQAEYRALSGATPGE